MSLRVFSDTCDLAPAIDVSQWSLCDDEADAHVSIGGRMIACQISLTCDYVKSIILFPQWALCSSVGPVVRGDVAKVCTMIG